MVVHPRERGRARHELGTSAMVGEVFGAPAIRRGRRGFEG
jgi:hypothetical protein